MAGSANRWQTSRFAFAGEEAAPVDKLMLLCLRARWQPTVAPTLSQFTAQSGHELDWAAWIMAAKARLVAPLLYRIVRGKAWCPAHVQRALQAEFVRNAARATLLMERVEEILACFDAQSIGVVLLKGMALAQAVYGDVALRPMKDVDLLVHKEDVPRALVLLEELGYVLTSTEPRAGVALKFENQLRLQRRDATRTIVELHWSLFDSPYWQQRLDMQWFWLTTNAITLGRTQTLVLGPEAQLLHLCGHMLFHHHAASWLWLVDIVETINANRERLDWNALLTQARRTNLFLPLRTILLDINRFWHVPAPPATWRLLQQARPSRQEQVLFSLHTRKSTSVAVAFIIDLLLQPSWRQRLVFAGHHLFPSRTYMKDRYALPSPAVLPFAYLYRWLRGVWGVWL